MKKKIIGLFFTGCNQYFIALTMNFKFIDSFISLKKFDFSETILLFTRTTNISIKDIEKLKLFVNEFTSIHIFNFFVPNSTHGY